MQFVLRCAVWYYSYNLKNVKNTHGGVLLLVKLQDSLLKITLLHGCFSRFLNCANGIKQRNPPHLSKIIMGWKKKSSLQLLETHAYHENHNIQTCSDMLCKREYFKCGRKKNLCYQLSWIRNFRAYGTWRTFQNLRCFPQNETRALRGNFAIFFRKIRKSFIKFSRPNTSDKLLRKSIVTMNII